jgi:hypothetical protein
VLYWVLLCCVEFYCVVLSFIVLYWVLLCCIEFYMDRENSTVSVTCLCTNLVQSVTLKLSWNNYFRIPLSHEWELKSLILKILILWNVTPCSLVAGHHLLSDMCDICLPNYSVASWKTVVLVATVVKTSHCAEPDSGNRVPVQMCSSVDNCLRKFHPYIFCESIDVTSPFCIHLMHTVQNM